MMVVHRNWSIETSTRECQKSNNLNDLSFNVMIKEGFERKIRPIKKGLHVHHINKDGDIIFGNSDEIEESSDANYHATLGTCSVIAEVMNDDACLDERNKENEDSVIQDAKVAGVTTRVRFIDTPEVDMDEDQRNVEVVVEKAIDTVEHSKSRFTKRDQQRADRVRRLQHVARFPSDTTMVCSTVTNGIKNNPITKRDVGVRN